MTQTPVNVGASPNDRTGDDFRDAYIKLNNNDADLDARVTLLSKLLSNTNPSYATVTISGFTIKGVGTAAGLVAAGNDARIVGALQAANNLSDVASPSAARTSLGLGSLAVQSASGAAITGGAINGTSIGGTTPAAGAFSTLSATTPLPVASGGSGAATPAGARAALGAAASGANTDITSLGPVAIAAGSTSTTPGAGDNSTKLATTAYIDRALSGAASPPALAQCRLIYVSASQLAVQNKDGNQVLINGTLRTITANITISNSGLTASTLYYFFLGWSGSTFTLTASTTAPTVTAASGMQTDATGALLFVGRAYVWSDGNFYDTNTMRLVATKYNKSEKWLLNNNGGNNYQFSFTTHSELSGGWRVYFVADPDDSVDLNATGYMASNSSSVGYYTYLSLSIDNSDTSPYSTPIQQANGAGYQVDEHGLSHNVAVADGLHYATFRGHATNGASPIWANAQISGYVRG